MTWHVIAVLLVALSVFVAGFLLGMHLTSSTVDEEIIRAFEVQTCTRLAPHVCTVNGSCNGWPKPNQKESI